MEGTEREGRVAISDGTRECHNQAWIQNRVEKGTSQ